MKTSHRATELLVEHRQIIARRTDYVLQRLMVFQWLAGILAALWLSPRTWAGLESHVHPHMWAAVFLGGLITALPVALAQFCPGQVVTRQAFAASQMLMSALLIHLSGGRLETHFHIFGSLAILAFYRDWRVLVTASLVIFTDHLARGWFWPESVYGVAWAPLWRAFEHAGWVVFEDVFLFISIRQSTHEMQRIADRQAQLESTNARIEQTVTERTGELLAENEQRRQAEEKHRKSERFLESTLDALSAHIAILDGTGRIVAVNAAWHKFAEANGALPTAFGPGANYLAVCEAASGACAAEARAVAAGLRRVISGQETEFQLEYPCHSPAEQRWFIVRVTCFRSENSLHMVVAHENVTARAIAENQARQRETELRTLFDLMPALVWFKDTHNGVLRVNQRVAEAAGKSVAEIEGKPSDVRFYADDLEVIRSGKPKLGILESIPGPDGRELWLQTDKVPYCDEAGKVIGIVVMAQDVTARRQTEMASNRLAAIVESSHDAIIGKDNFGIITSWNQGAEIIFGYTSDEMVGTSILRLIPADRQNEEIDILSKIKRGENLDQFETIRQKKDGQLIYVSVTASPIKDAAGQILGISKVVRDITEQRRAGEELRGKTALLEAQVNSTIDGLLVVDDQGKTLLQNQRLVDLFQIPTHIAAQKDDGLRLQWVKNSTKDPSQFLERVAYLNARPHETSRDEIELKDGRILDRYSSPVIGQHGKYYGRIWTFRDMTERKLAENSLRESNEKFHQLADNITDVFWVRSSDLSEIQYISPAFAQVWGRPVETLLENPEKWVEFIFPADRERVTEAFAALTGAAPKLDIEYRILRPDGEIRWVHVRGFQIRDAVGQVSRHIGVVTDITDRKQAEAELQKAHKQLLEISRQAGMAEVATGVLHNVGNVLNSVNVSATLVADKIKKSKVVDLGRVVALLDQHTDDLAVFLTSDARGQHLRPYLRQLHENLSAEQRGMVGEIESLRQNIEHIKEIIAMQQNYGKISGVTETVQVTDLLEDTLRMNSDTFAHHEVRVVREFAPVPPVTVEKHRVLQVLVNLVRNAKHACQAREGIDRTMTLRVFNGDGTVKVQVADNGVGIPPENLTRIFSHGFTTKKTGHGFGLHSSALTAQELGGALTVQSGGPGQGATFTLELPISSSRVPQV